MFITITKLDNKPPNLLISLLQIIKQAKKVGIGHLLTAFNVRDTKQMN